ncbi:hypothetical protein F5X98DRAFT_353310, partial [Xylaria grammica]
MDHRRPMDVQLGCGRSDANIRRPWSCTQAVPRIGFGNSPERTSSGPEEALLLHVTYYVHYTAFALPTLISPVTYLPNIVHWPTSHLSQRSAKVQYLDSFYLAQTLTGIYIVYCLVNC